MAELVQAATFDAPSVTSTPFSKAYSAVDSAVQYALERDGFMEGVEYKRYKHINKSTR